MYLFLKKEIKQNYIPCSGKEFVGIIYKKNEIDIYYPKFYKLSEENKEDVYDLLKAIVLTKRSTRKYNVYKQSTGYFDFPLESYDWIWKHYKKNGRYFEKECRYKENGFGKIDWKKTLKQIPSLINDNFQYLNTINKSYKNTETIMTDIYSFCVCESYEKVQWMFEKNYPDICRVNKKISKSLLRIFKDTLLIRLSSTFDDDLKQLFTHMLNVINGCNSGQSENQVFGIESFDMVFEKMIYTVFHNVGNISSYYPKAFYKKTNDLAYLEQASSLREDTIFIDENQKLFIIDSKYYCDSYPQVESISKQIVYGEYIENNHKKLSKLKPYKKDQIINVFLLPRESKNSSEIFSTNFVYATADWKNGNKLYEKIMCIEVDLCYLIKNWNKNNTSVFQAKFVKIIDSFLNAF